MIYFDTNNETVVKMKKFSKYNAISIDNSTLKSLKYNFEKSLLNKLEQFKGTGVELLVPDIILIEIKKHLLQDTINAKPKIEEFKTTIEANFFPELNSALEVMRNLKTDEIAELVDSRIQIFLQATGAKILNSSEYLHVDSLIDLYKNTQLPFENTEKKKREFPDAIALLVLEGYAETHEKNILTVSGDKGWGKYCSQSNELDVRTKLSEAIEILVLQNNQDKFFEQFEDNGFDIVFLNALNQKLDGKISVILEQEYIHAEADSHLSTCDNEVENLSFISADYQSIELIEINHEINEFSIKLRGSIDFEVEASFSFSVWDSIDKEEINLSSRMVSGKFEKDFEAIVICDFEPEKLKDLDNIEISIEDFSLDNDIVNFGYIEAFDESWYEE